MARWAFSIIYTGSGAAGLIYQVVWTRLLATYLGHTVAAAGTVLAAFMGGLAAGSLLAGAVASRGLAPARALRLYAAAELLIGFSALALPFGLDATTPLLTWAYGTQPGAAFGLARLTTSLLLVFVPAAVMGATFPLAVRAMSVHGARAADAGRLYACNTAGAAAGATLAGFVFIPAVGLLRTTLVGVALNAIAAVIALGLARHATGPESPSVADVPRRGRRRPPSTPPRPVAPAAPHLAVTIAGISGFAALVYEVAFTRALAVVLGPTSYAFAAMLAAFITGLALGSAIAARVSRRPQRAAALIVLALTLSAAAVAGAAWFTGARLPLVIAAVVADPAARGAHVLTQAALYASAVLLPLSVTLGAVFPLCLALAAGDADLPAGVAGRLYGVNTVCGIVGSLGAAFLLIPLLGVRQTLILAGVTALLAAALALRTPAIAPVQRGALGLSMVAALGLLIALPRWDAALLSAGGYKYAADIRDLQLDLGLGLRAGRLEFYREGAAGAVSVRRIAGTVALAIDGKVDASNGPDMVTQTLLAHLPLLLHPAPDEVCIVGLGSGVTLGAALQHPIARADVVEISRDVVAASDWFAAENHHGLADPRTHLIVGDGRSHLRYTSRQYDVVISEPSNPWMAGASALFTREFFEDVRRRLAADGLVCQWAHTYDLAETDLRLLIRTFTSVFPNATLWLVGRGDVLLIARRDGAPPDLSALARHWTRNQVDRDLADAGVFDPFSLLSLFVTGGDRLRAYAAGTAVETDDRPRVEFSGPVGIYDGREARATQHTLQALAEVDLPAAIREARATAGAPEWRNRGRLSLRVRDYEAAFDQFTRAIEHDPEDAAALDGLIEAAGASGRTEEARRVIGAAARGTAGRLATRAALARLLAAMGRMDEALQEADAALRDAPDHRVVVETAASIAADAGDRMRLQPIVAQLQATWPERDETWYYTAMFAFLNDDMEGTVRLAGRAVEINPNHALAWSLIGSAHASRGRRREAAHAFERARLADPYEPATYANLGRLALESGDRESALAYFQEALSLDPAEPTARHAVASLSDTSALRR
ncbi:MAG: fused MFS/spermidine synthase [Vicinamibacterales bacterium]